MLWVGRPRLELCPKARGHSSDYIICDLKYTACGTVELSTFHGRESLCLGEYLRMNKHED